MNPYEFKRENALDVFVVDSLQALDESNDKLKTYRKRYTNKQFVIKTTTKLILRNGERTLLRDSPTNVVELFKQDSTGCNLTLMNYFAREVYVFLVDRKTGKIYSHDEFSMATDDRLNMGGSYVPNSVTHEVTSGTVTPSDLKKVTSIMNDLLLRIKDGSDLTRVELRSFSDFCKEYSYEVGKLIPSTYEPQYFELDLDKKF